MMALMPMMVGARRPVALILARVLVSAVVDATEPIRRTRLIVGAATALAIATLILMFIL